MQLNGREFTIRLTKEFDSYVMYKSDEEFRGASVLNGVYMPRWLFSGDPPTTLLITIEVPRRLGL